MNGQGVWECSTCGHVNMVAKQRCYNCDQEPRRTLTDGTQIYPEHRAIEPETGQQRGYVVLAEEERAKGFIRPVRRTYTHLKCGSDTTMGQTVVLSHKARSAP